MFKIEIDFTVFDDLSPKSLLVWDISRWEFIRDKPSVITIQYEDNNPVVEYFAKNRLNVIDSYRIFGDENKELPDGLYTITVKGSPSKHKKERYVYVTNQIRKEIDLLYTTSNSEEEKENLWKYEQMLFSIKALVRRAKVVEAQEVYEALSQQVEDYKNYGNCKNC